MISVIDTAIGFFVFLSDALTGNNTAITYAIKDSHNKPIGYTHQQNFSCDVNPILLLVALTFYKKSIDIRIMFPSLQKNNINTFKLLQLIFNFKPNHIYTLSPTQLLSSTEHQMQPTITSLRERSALEKAQTLKHILGDDSTINLLEVACFYSNLHAIKFLLDGGWKYHVTEKSFKIVSFLGNNAAKSVLLDNLLFVRSPQMQSLYIHSEYRLPADPLTKTTIILHEGFAQKIITIDQVNDGGVSRALSTDITHNTECYNFEIAPDGFGHISISGVYFGNNLVPLNAVKNIFGFLDAQSIKNISETNLAVRHCAKSLKLINTASKQKKAPLNYIETQPVSFVDKIYYSLIPLIIFCVTTYLSLYSTSLLYILPCFIINNYLINIVITNALDQSYTLFEFINKVLLRHDLVIQCLPKSIYIYCYLFIYGYLCSWVLGLLLAQTLPYLLTFINPNIAGVVLWLISCVLLDLYQPLCQLYNYLYQGQCKINTGFKVLNLFLIDIAQMWNKGSNPIKILFNQKCTNVTCLTVAALSSSFLNIGIPRACFSVGVLAAGIASKFINSSIKPVK
jgi:hypothetical protein